MEREMGLRHGMAYSNSQVLPFFSSQLYVCMYACMKLTFHSSVANTPDTSVKVFNQYFSILYYRLNKLLIVCFCLLFFYLILFFCYFFVALFSVLIILL